MQTPALFSPSASPEKITPHHGSPVGFLTTSPMPGSEPENTTRSVSSLHLGHTWRPDGREARVDDELLGVEVAMSCL